uniref:Pathogen-related protein n=1 Tax=Solanum lycopersicum TaxID=4081 RepID=A0A3Q7EYP5_SOLLC
MERRHGSPPIYDSVNNVFEQGRTKVWPKGSLEETIQNSKKTWEMEIKYKTGWEVINVYTGPPVVTYKFRHWGFFEGPLKGHAPTGEMIQFYGIGIMKVDKYLRMEELELYYDPTELFVGLLKGPKISESNIEQGQDDNTTTQQCPLFNHS